MIKQQAKPPNRRMPKGGVKRPQRFTKRDVERAHLAAPNRTIRICKDGTLELLPPATGSSTSEQQEDDRARERGASKS